MPVNVLCARPSGKSTVKYTSDTNTPMVNGNALDFLIRFSSQATDTLDSSELLDLLYTQKRCRSTNKTLGDDDCDNLLHSSPFDQYRYWGDTATTSQRPLSHIPKNVSARFEGCRPLQGRDHE